MDSSAIQRPSGVILVSHQVNHSSAHHRRCEIPPERKMRGVISPWGFFAGTKVAFDMPFELRWHHYLGIDGTHQVPNR
jgi:hypothetical protein